MRNNRETPVKAAVFRIFRSMPSFHPHLRGSSIRYHSQGRDKRSGEDRVWGLQDCMTVSSKEEGVWEYVSDGRDETCGLYLVTLPDLMVEVELLQLDVDCDSGLVVVRYLK